MIIALSGPAASGKGTLAKLLAERLGLPHYDFGLMFRGIIFLSQKYEFERIGTLISKHYLKFTKGRFLFRWLDLTSHLSSEEVGLQTARTVRENLGAVIQLACAMVQDKSIVCDGRTCGNEIYPDADFIFYITASFGERKNRRVRDSAENAAFSEREHLDSQRLQISPNAITIETTNKTKEESLEEILSHLKNYGFVL